MDNQVVIGIVGAAVLVLLFIRNWRRSQARLKALRGGEEPENRNKDRRVVP